MPFKSGAEWKGNKEGRPSMEREASRLLLLAEVVGAKEYKILCQEAYLAARGKKVITVEKDGKQLNKLVDDTDATPASKLSYLRWIDERLHGKAIQPIVSDEANGELLKAIKPMLDEMSAWENEKLDEIIVNANREIEKEKNRKRRKRVAGDRSANVARVSES